MPQASTGFHSWSRSLPHYLPHSWAWPSTFGWIYQPSHWSVGGRGLSWWPPPKEVGKPHWVAWTWCWPPLVDGWVFHFECLPWKHIHQFPNHLLSICHCSEGWPLGSGFHSCTKPKCTNFLPCSRMMGQWCPSLSMRLNGVDMMGRRIKALGPSALNDLGTFDTQHAHDQ